MTIVKALFTFDVSGLDYLASSSTTITASLDTIKILAVFYKDEDVKFKSVITYPSGNRIQLEHPGSRNLDEAMQNLQKIIQNLVKGCPKGRITYEARYIK